MLINARMKSRLIWMLVWLFFTVLGGAMILCYLGRLSLATVTKQRELKKSNSFSDTSADLHSMHLDVVPRTVETGEYHSMMGVDMVVENIKEVEDEGGGLMEKKIKENLMKGSQGMEVVDIWGSTNDEEDKGGPFTKNEERKKRKMVEEWQRLEVNEMVKMKLHRDNVDKGGAFMERERKEGNRIDEGCSVQEEEVLEKTYGKYKNNKHGVEVEDVWRISNEEEDEGGGFTIYKQRKERKMFEEWQELEDRDILEVKLYKELADKGGGFIKREMKEGKKMNEVKEKKEIVEKMHDGYKHDSCLSASKDSQEKYVEGRGGKASSGQEIFQDSGKEAELTLESKSKGEEGLKEEVNKMKYNKDKPHVGQQFERAEVVNIYMTHENFGLHELNSAREEGEETGYRYIFEDWSTWMFLNHPILSILAKFILSVSIMVPLFTMCCYSMRSNWRMSKQLKQETGRHVDALVKMNMAITAQKVLQKEVEGLQMSMKSSQNTQKALQKKIKDLLEFMTLAEENYSKLEKEMEQLEEEKKSMEKYLKEELQQYSQNIHQQKAEIERLHFSLLLITNNENDLVEQDEDGGIAKEDEASNGGDKQGILEERYDEKEENEKGEVQKEEDELEEKKGENKKEEEQGEEVNVEEKEEGEKDEQKMGEVKEEQKQDGVKEENEVEVSVEEDESDLTKEATDKQVMQIQALLNTSKYQRDLEGAEQQRNSSLSSLHPYYYQPQESNEEKKQPKEHVSDPQLADSNDSLKNMEIKLSALSDYFHQKKVDLQRQLVIDKRRHQMMEEKKHITEDKRVQEKQQLQNLRQHREELKLVSVNKIKNLVRKAKEANAKLKQVDQERRQTMNKATVHKNRVAELKSVALSQPVSQTGTHSPSTELQPGTDVSQNDLIYVSCLKPHNTSRASSDMDTSVSEKGVLLKGSKDNPITSQPLKITSVTQATSTVNMNYEETKSNQADSHPQLSHPPHHGIAYKPRLLYPPPRPPYWDSFSPFRPVHFYFYPSTGVSPFYPWNRVMPSKPMPPQEVNNRRNREEKAATKPQHTLATKHPAATSKDVPAFPRPVMTAFIPQWPNHWLRIKQYLRTASARRLLMAQGYTQGSGRHNQSSLSAF